ncbi:MAG TPA: chemotaxis protein CheA [Terriglobales bacterium]|nr:chemotaxis protein CheA [Terriglobales bacterium]
MSPYNHDPGAEMRELFFETSQELLQSLNDDALKLENSPENIEVVRSIRRTVHTLKGDAAACGFKELSSLAHQLEDALAVEAVITPEALVELSFKAADLFSEMLRAYREQTPLPDTSELVRLAQNLVPAATGAGRKPKDPRNKVPSVSWTESEQTSARAAQQAGYRIFHVIAHIDQLCGMPIAARQLVISALGAVAQVLAVRPEIGSAENAKKLDLLAATAASETDIVSKCLIPTVISRVEYFEIALSGQLTKAVEPLSVGEASLAEASAIEPSSAEARRSNTAESSSAESMAQTSRPALPENLLRVDAERIDDVLNLVGELIIAKSMLQQTMQEFTRRYPKDALRPRFVDAMGFQSRVLNDLQRSVMKIRMVPVEQLFRRFPRIVHDAAKTCGKQVQLTLRGQDTDLDKGLLDAIAEPLTHIVRNAVSHGIESPSQREKIGKNPVGTVQLNAYHQANQLIVEVIDDGSGIDAAKIKAKALKANLISSEVAGRMTTQEIYDLIFRPGFSTADEITEISGRGVGLDVVHSVLMRIKGTIETETDLGQGTTFRLKLPLTLAIIQALMFRIEHRLYAIPLNAVAEIARAWESDLHYVDGTEVLQLRNQVLPLVRVGERLISDRDPSKEKIFVLVLTYGERKLGLIVDALEGEEELVIKALDDQTVSSDLVSSASILGDGRVVLIMNLAAVMDRFVRGGTNVSQAGLFSRGRQDSRLAEVRQ